jgi:hypothetical protein
LCGTHIHFPALKHGARVIPIIMWRRLSACGLTGLSSPVFELATGKSSEPADKNVCATYKMEMLYCRKPLRGNTCFVENMLRPLLPERHLTQPSPPFHGGEGDGLVWVV